MSISSWIPAPEIKAANAAQLLKLIDLCRELGHREAEVAGQRFYEALCRAAKEDKANCQDHEPIIAAVPYPVTTSEGG